MMGNINDVSVTCECCYTVTKLRVRIAYKPFQTIFCPICSLPLGIKVGAVDDFEAMTQTSIKNKIKRKKLHLTQKQISLMFNGK